MRFHERFHYFFRSFFYFHETLRYFHEGSTWTRQKRSFHCLHRSYHYFHGNYLHGGFQCFHGSQNVSLKYSTTFMESISIETLVHFHRRINHFLGSLWKTRSGPRTDTEEITAMAASYGSGALEFPRKLRRFAWKQFPWKE